MYEDRKEALMIIEEFHSISTRSLELLSEYGKILKFAKGNHLFLDKEEGSNFYIVVSGLVTLYKLNTQGDKKVIFILDKGKMINEEVLQGLSASISCEVFESAQILCFDKEDFLSVMEQDFELNKAVFHSLALKTRRLYRQLKNTSTSIRGDKRIAAKLWKLSGDYGLKCETGICINIEMSITYLADMLGSKRETVSRQVKALTEQGLIFMDKGKIIVRDRDQLANYFKTS